MKKSMRICALVAVAACFTVTAGCSGYKRYKDSNYSVYNSDEYSEGGVTLERTVSAIEADWLCGKVEIKAHDGTDFVLSETVTSGELNDDGLKMRYITEENTLKIKFAASRNFVPSNFKKTLTVLVPATLNLSEVEIDCVSADASVSGLKINELEAETVSGDISVEDCEIIDADIGSTSGKVNVVNCNVSGADLDTTSGVISFSGTAQTIEAGSTSGKIGLSVDNLPTEIKIKTTSSDVELNMKGEKNFKIKYSTTSGKFKSELPCFVNGKVHVFGDGTSEYKISTVSGDLTVN